MSKIIVSYDGTANEDDAIALGRLLGRAGAEVSVAYVRHAHESDADRESLAQSEAQELVDRGVALLGLPGGAGHVVTDRSTPDGLAALAAREGAEAIVFCSDSHTAKGHLSIGNSAQRLIEGGSVAVAIAPVDLAEGGQLRHIVAVGDGDGGARETAEAIARSSGGEVVPVANEQTDLLVIDSRPETEPGRISISASAEHLIEIATCAVLVLPRGARLSLGATTAAAA